MKRRDFLNVSTGLVGLGLVGCGDDDVMTDAGLGMDAAADALAPNDVGTDSAADDAGTDAGTDAGPAADAGVPDVGTDAAAEMCVMVTFIMGEEHDRGPHGTGLVFPAADVIAGVPVQYDITGASRHPHTLDVSAEHFAALAAGESVTIRSSFDSRHVHDVTLQCMN